MDCFLGVELMNKGSVQGVEAALRRHGGVHNLPIVDGPIIPKFDPYYLAEALDQEIARSIEVGWPKISLHMDLLDAKRMALFLRENK